MGDSSGRFRARRAIGPASLLLVAVLAACNQQPALVAPPPNPVVVASPLKLDLVDYATFTGQTSPVQSVDLMARVPGYLRSVEFVDGTDVEESKELFLIEPEPYQAQVDLAQATVEQHKAQLKSAEAEFERQQTLQQQSVSTQANYDRALANRDSERAAVAEAQANLTTAKINLSYTKVLAPFSGRIGRRLVDPGNLVGQGAPTKLATIQDISRIYVYFTAAEPDVLRFRRALAQEGMTRETISRIPVEAGLQDDTGYPYKGKLDFVDTGHRHHHRHAAGARRHRQCRQEADPGPLHAAADPARRPPAPALVLPETALRRRPGRTLCDGRRQATTWSPCAGSPRARRRTACAWSRAASRRTTASSSRASRTPLPAARSPYARARSPLRRHPEGGGGAGEILHRAADPRQRHRLPDDRDRRRVACCYLPVAQYPPITPPTVQVTARYPGASAQTVVDTVALPIEQQVNGVENMLYMQSTAANDGTYTLIVTFAVGTDLDIAQVLVQNRVAAALALAAAGGPGAGRRDARRSRRRSCRSSTLDLARTAATTACSCATTRRSACATSSRACPAWATSRVFGIGQYSMRDLARPASRCRRARSMPPDVDQRDPAAEPGGRRRPGRRAADARRARRSSSRSTCAGRFTTAEEFEDIVVKTDNASGGSITRHPRRRPRRARRADLQPVLQRGRQARRRHRHLPAARRQRARRRPSRCRPRWTRLAKAFPGRASPTPSPSTRRCS